MDGFEGEEGGRGGSIVGGEIGVCGGWWDDILLVCAVEGDRHGGWW